MLPIVYCEGKEARSSLSASTHRAEDRGVAQLDLRTAIGQPRHVTRGQLQWRTLRSQTHLVTEL